MAPAIQADKGHILSRKVYIKQLQLVSLKTGANVS